MGEIKLSDTTRKIKVTFLPGCFDNFNGSADEMAVIMNGIIDTLTSSASEGEFEIIERDEFVELFPDIANELMLSKHRTLH